MSLYRLDFDHGDGRREPVADPILGGDYLSRDRGRARTTAKYAATQAGVPVIGTRIYGAGSMRQSFYVKP